MKKITKVLAVLLSVVLMAQVLGLPASAVSEETRVKRMLRSFQPISDAPGAVQPSLEPNPWHINAAPRCGQYPTRCTCTIHIPRLFFSNIDTGIKTLTNCMRFDDGHEPFPYLDNTPQLWLRRDGYEFYLDY